MFQRLLMVIPAYRELVEARRRLATLNTLWRDFKSAYAEIQRLGSPETRVDRESLRRFTQFANITARQIERELGCLP